MKDDIVEGYNWTNFPFREDPNTHQRICKDCWNGRHMRKVKTPTGSRLEPCKVADCGCLCFAQFADIARERGLKSARTAERRRKQAEALAAPDNPLQAVNPAYKATS